MQRVWLAVACGLAVLASAAAADAVPCSIIIQTGDSIFGIAQKYDLTQADVEDANPSVANIELIQPGDVLALPCDGNATEAATILDLLANRQDTTLTFAAVVAGGFVDMLNDTTLVGTLFAPIDYGWEHLMERLNMTLDDFFADKELLTTVLKYHFSPEAALEAESLEHGQNITTALEGEDLVVYKPRDILRLATTSGRKVRVMDTDLAAGKALVHTVVNVLWPANKLMDLPAPSGDCVHVVEANDTLYTIAQDSKTTVASLIELNPELEANGGQSLQLGQEIILFPSCAI